jgi:hypothetical protein
LIELLDLRLHLIVYRHTTKIERLLVEKRETRERVKAKKEAMEFCLEKMVANQEKSEAKMDVWLEETKTCREST